MLKKNITPKQPFFKNTAYEHLLFLKDELKLSTKDFNQALKSLVSPEQHTLLRFLSLLFLSLGIGSLVAGTIFFFAYNWDDLPRLVKLGLAQGLLVVSLLGFFIAKQKTIKNICLLGSSMMVGTLFALYGQVYQSTADSYTLFLAWFVFIFAWALVANFAPLWALCIALINMAYFQYNNQFEIFSTAGHFTTLILANSCLLAYVFKSWLHRYIPQWFVNTLLLYCMTVITFSSVYAISDILFGYDAYIPKGIGLLALGVGIVGAIYRYGIQQKQLLFVMTCYLYAIIVITTFILAFFGGNEIGTYLLASSFIIGSLIVVVPHMITLKKQWTVDSHDNADELNKTHTAEPTENIDSQTGIGSQTAIGSQTIPSQINHTAKQEFLTTFDSLIKDQPKLLQSSTNGDITEQTLKQTMWHSFTKHTSNHSYIIDIISFVGGLMATGFLSIFLFLGGILESAIGLGVFGVLVFIGAILLNRSDKSGLEGASVCFYLEGCTCIAAALMDDFSHQSLLILALLIFASLFFIQTFLMRFVACITGYFIILFSFDYLDLITYNNSDNNIVLTTFIMCTLMLLALIGAYTQQSKWLTSQKIQSYYAPIKMAIVVLYLVSINFFSLSDMFDKVDNTLYHMLFSLFVMSVIGVLLIQFAKTHQNKLFYIIAGIFFIALLPTVQYSAIAASILLLLIAFSYGDKKVFVLAVLAVLYFIFQFYYLMEIDLLTKSMLMLASGLFFMVVFWVISRFKSIPDMLEHNTQIISTQDKKEAK